MVSTSRSLVGLVVLAMAIVVLAMAIVFGLAPARARQGAGSGGAPRLALVIGNADYPAAPLPTTANDAGLVAQTLSQAGFAVTATADADGETVRKTFRDFTAKVKAAGPDVVVFVYLAGYGVQYDGDTFLVPVEAVIPYAADVPDEAVRLADLTAPLEALPAKTRIFVEDLARAHPFAQGGIPLAGGLAMVQPAKGSVYAFNAAPGMVAIPDIAPYGFYARALAEMIQEPGLSMPALFDRVRLRVVTRTNGAVAPWVDGAQDDGFTFFPASAVAPDPVIASSEQKPIGAMGADDAFAATLTRDTLSGDQDFLSAFPQSGQAPRVRTMMATRREALIWGQTRRANVPRAYWTYMRRYPRGPHFGDARRALAALKASLEPPPRFDIFEYDNLVPPPPGERTTVDRRFVTLDDPGWDPVPPVDSMLPPPRSAFYDDLPPPPPVPIGVLPVPMPVSLPRSLPGGDGGLAQGGRIVQPSVPGYGPVHADTTFESAGPASLALETAGGTLISRTTTTVKPGVERVIVQRDARGALVSRTTTTYGGGAFTTIQIGPDGAILIKSIARNDPGGGRSTVVTNGDDQLIATSTSDKEGVVTAIMRGRVPVRDQNFFFAPATKDRPKPIVAALAEAPARPPPRPKPQRAPAPAVEMSPPAPPPLKAAQPGATPSLRSGTARDASRKGPEPAAAPSVAAAQPDAPPPTNAPPPATATVEPTPQATGAAAAPVPTPPVRPSVASLRVDAAGGPDKRTRTKPAERARNRREALPAKPLRRESRGKAAPKATSGKAPARRAPTRSRQKKAR